ncbi:MAG: HTTM domain-containing protein [Acidimicrobiia bacterium]
MNSVERWLLTPAPPERLAALRMVIGGFAVGYLLVRLPHLFSVAEFDEGRFDPVGVVGGLDAPLAPGLFRALVVTALVTGVAFVAGWRYRLCAPVFAALLLVVLTYRNSWGQVFHSENLLVLQVVILALAPAAAAWSLDRRRQAGSAPAAAAEFGWPIQVMCLVTVTAYVVTGVAKLRYGGDAWIAGDVLRNQVAFDNLRKVALGDVHSPIGGAAVAHAWVFRPLAVITLAIELGAPAALLPGWPRRGWVAAAWLFHVGILALMAIVFPYQLLGISFAPFFAVERIPAWVRARVARRPATGAEVRELADVGS